MSVSEDDSGKAGTEAEDEPVTVEVPQIDDDELSSFFITACQHQDQRQREEASIDTFNDMFIDSNDMYALTVLSAVCSSGSGHFPFLRPRYSLATTT